VEREGRDCQRGGPVGSLGEPAAAGNGLAAIRFT
jgi:hypothetical protein